MTKTKIAQEPVAESILVEETRLGVFQLKVTTGCSTIMLDEPIGAGGIGSGPNPYDLMSAALGASMITTMRTYADTRRWPLEKVRIRVLHHHLSLRGPPTFLHEIVLHGALEEHQKAKLMDIALSCPIQQFLERGVQIKAVLIKEPAGDQLAVTNGDHMRDVLHICKREA